MRIAHPDQCVNTTRHLAVALPATSPISAKNAPQSALQLANQRLAARQAAHVAAWGKRPTDTSRPSRIASQPSSAKTTTGWLTPLVEGALSTQMSTISETVQEEPVAYVKAYPSLLTAMLREEVAAVGRVWMLCRALDSEGKGWLSVELVRARLACKQSDWRIVGWRRMRQLLQQGKGVFWERDSFGRIWLYGTAKVAENLTITRLEGNPVKLPISDLISGLQQTKAAFYAAFHAGRKTHNPISRATLAEVTGTSEATQRSYEAHSNIGTRKNYCVSGLSYTPKNVQTEAYKRPIVFAFQDHKTGQRLIAWPLPNSYEAKLAIACRGRQRKINRQLKSTSDLVIQGRGGTGGDFGRIFCTTGRQAAQQTDTPERYWEGKQKQWGCI